MSKIIELPESLANQIAAGEVVERPASVVKELVENAIDAGATRVTVEVKESGLQLIEVTDNGAGIEAVDVPKALLRHATSKIKDSNDLFRIRTLGFRGEALPSIASVSALTIETCTASEAAGTRLISQGGTIQRTEPLAKIQGTKVRVAQLFYNTPARLKYIRSLQAELSHITDIVNREVLAHPSISFTLISDGHRLTTSTGSGNLKQAIAGIYGMQTARKLVALSAQDLDFKISGYIALPELTRANRSYTTLLVNGRYIKNFLLAKAVLEGYGSKLMVGRYPLAVVSITTDPQLLDVNVHPTKQEIRLSKEKELRELLINAIRKALSAEVLIPDALENLTSHGGRGAVQAQTSLSSLSVARQANQAVSADRIKSIDHTQFDEIFAPKKFVQTELEVHEASVNYALIDEAPEVVTKPSPSLENISERPSTFPELQFLAQLHRTYLLCEAADGLYIVDQHAAQERVKYEYYRNKIGEVSFDQQQLLVPLLIELPKNDFLTVLSALPKLEEAGIFLSEYGDNQLIMREHPVWMREGEMESATYALIDLLLSGKEATVAKYREALAIMISCKSSIKANMLIDPESARSLLRQLSACENPYNCPHGRPSVVHFTGKDMEKMFRRIMQGHDSARKNQEF